ncbi:MAG TPA: glycosyl hydrolase family 28-related protein, partial [Prolixibacteraceae bacterium]|nr:glycosyl hydrolase family 28-related protein [Prolixibacteraceae bacterium]
VGAGDTPRDAGAGTFYSAISNIDFTIEEGNPHAVVLRTHFAQHGFVSHSVMNIGKGKAGIFDVGNELENVKFIGGEYGIYTYRTSPGWPMMIVDTWFENQRKAAILTYEAGLAIVKMQVRNVPVVVEMGDNKPDRLYMEECLFENVTEAAIKISHEGNTFTQVNLQNIDCHQVPVLASFLKSGQKVMGLEKSYRVRDFTYGLVMEDLEADSRMETMTDLVPIDKVPAVLTPEIPTLPPMSAWVNIRQLGAAGDGDSDDTPVFREALEKYKTIYVPQGWYRITGTLKMRPGTRIIGLHPFATQFVLKESEPAFSGFGAPVAMVESSAGGDDIINGIGLSTGGYNYRAVGCKWMAGEKSLLNDVKFVGGHGSMQKPALPVAAFAQDANPQRSAGQNAGVPGVSVRAASTPGVAVQAGAGQGAPTPAAAAQPAGGAGSTGQGAAGQQAAGQGTLTPGGTAPGASGQRAGQARPQGRGPAISSPSSPVTATGMDLAWDNQYWSLWVTNNGGGIIKDIWTANTYAASGLYVSNTATPGRIYAMSLEHHVRNEARFENVQNWKMMAFQFEEEGREGKECQMMEISGCHDLLFANLWMYRVIRVTTPQPYGIKVRNSKNIEFRNMHSYTQVLQVIEFPVYEANKELPVYPWDFARLTVTGSETGKLKIPVTPGKMEKLAGGFNFTTGATSDSKGNVYFCE